MIPIRIDYLDHCPVLQLTAAACSCRSTFTTSMATPDHQFTVGRMPKGRSAKKTSQSAAQSISSIIPDPVGGTRGAVSPHAGFIGRKAALFRSVAFINLTIFKNREPIPDSRSPSLFGSAFLFLSNLIPSSPFPFLATERGRSQGNGCTSRPPAVSHRLFSRPFDRRLPYGSATLTPDPCTGSLCGRTGLLTRLP